MNVWYIAAIIMGTLTAFCGYYGSVVQNRRSSEEQSSRLETQLQTLGTEIQELRREADTPDKSAKIEYVDEKYRELAEKFFRSVPVRRAEEEARTAQQQVQEIQKTQKVEAYFRAIKRESEKLADAYNQAAGNIVLDIEGNDGPENLFRPDGEHPAYILMKFFNKKFWMIRIITFNVNFPAINFCRVLSIDESLDISNLRLTNDSISLVLFNGEFGVSLHQAISDGVNANVAKDVSRQRQPLEKLEALATELTRRIIEYELLPIEPPK